MDVPVVLVLVTDHGERLCHSGVYAFDATVSGRVVGSSREFVDAEQFIYGSCELGAKLRSVIGQEGGWTSPERDVTVHQDIDGTFCGEM